MTQGGFKILWDEEAQRFVILCIPGVILKVRKHIAYESIFLTEAFYKRKIPLLIIGRKSKSQSVASVTFLWSVLSGLCRWVPIYFVYCKYVRFFRGWCSIFPLQISPDCPKHSELLFLSSESFWNSHFPPIRHFFTADEDVGPGPLWPPRIIILDPFFNVSKSLMPLSHPSSIFSILPTSLAWGCLAGSPSVQNFSKESSISRTLIKLLHCGS